MIFLLDLGLMVFAIDRLDVNVLFIYIYIYEQKAKVSE